MEYSTLDWNCHGKTIALLSNQHFYPICNNTYKKSYVFGNTCMQTTPGGSVDYHIPCYKDQGTRLTKKQLKYIEDENEEQQEEDETYSYARTKGHLTHQNKRYRH